MNSLKLVVIAALGLTACGPAGQPRIYRVAVDTTPVQNLNNPQCFKGNMPNLNQITQEQNYRQEAVWVIWDAAESKQYLDMGNSTFTMADSPTIKVTDLIEGTQNVFSATRQQQDRGNIIELQTTNVVTTLSDLNATPTGTIALNAQYQCQNGSAPCPAEPNKRSCNVTLNFWARKIEVQQTANYTPAGTGISASTP